MYNQIKSPSNALQLPLCKTQVLSSPFLHPLYFQNYLRYFPLLPGSPLLFIMFAPVTLIPSNPLSALTWLKKIFEKMRLALSLTGSHRQRMTVAQRRARQEKLMLKMQRQGVTDQMWLKVTHAKLPEKGIQFYINLFTGDKHLNRTIAFLCVFEI